MATRRGWVDPVTYFLDVYRDRRVLVTGHTGFKGGWLSNWLVRMGAEVVGYALAPDTEPSHHAILALAQEEYLVDLRDARAVRQAVTGSADIVFHLAASRWCAVPTASLR
jgi:CDP-glucose 4,6-dehydratase